MPIVIYNLDGCRLLSQLRRRHQHSKLNRILLKTTFHCLLSFAFVTFLIHCNLSPAASSNYVSWCWSRFVCSGLTYEIYSGGGPSTYVYCMVSYHLIAAPYVRTVVMSLHIITLLMTIRLGTPNGLWDFFTHNVFPYRKWMCLNMLNLSLEVLRNVLSLLLLLLQSMIGGGNNSIVCSLK